MQKRLKLILPLLLALYIATETILKVNNIALCSSTGCKLAGDLLKFNSIYLNYLGIAAALWLALLALFQTQFANRLYTFSALAMVAFESLLIASQLNLNPEVCIFCLGVYTFLLLILFNVSKEFFLYALGVVASIFVAFSFLNIPKNKTLLQKDGLYLIASQSCPHCQRTKKFLKKEGVTYSIINANDINSFYFAKSLDIKKIPIAIEKSGEEFTITVGDSNIMHRYGKKEAPKEPAQNAPTQAVQPLQPTLDYSGSKGCSYTVTETPDCEAKDGSAK